MFVTVQIKLNSFIKTKETIVENMITLTSYHFEDTIKMNIPTIYVAIIMIKFLVQRILVIIEAGSVTVRERGRLIINLFLLNMKAML